MKQGAGRNELRFGEERIFMDRLRIRVFQRSGAHKVDFGKEICRRKLYHGWVMFLQHYMEAGISVGRKVAFSEKSRSSV